MTNSTTSRKRKTSQFDLDDALLCLLGLESYVQATGRYGSVTEPRPGLNGTCARFIPNVTLPCSGGTCSMRVRIRRVIRSRNTEYFIGTVWRCSTTHCSRRWRGLCQQRRYEFMFMRYALKVARGTGSPVNPIALF